MEFEKPNTNLINAFYPFSSVRNMEDLRMGIFSFKERWNYVNDKPTGVIHPLQLPYQLFTIENSTSLIQYNALAIAADFALITNNRTSNKIAVTNNVIAPQNIFIEDGVVMDYCTINASEGFVYIGKDALIMEGSMIRGSVSIGENAVVKMGTKIYSGTSIGANCTVGGEIKNSIIYPNSNKAHDGYLGDSIIGEWCNIGAGTSNSNIKNTAGTVTLQLEHATLHAGNKFGLLMGDYSRCAINSSFNTGSVVGICCNIFGQNVIPTFTKNFTWGTETYNIEKALQHIDNWMQLKKQHLTAAQKQHLQQLYTKTT